MSRSPDKKFVPYQDAVHNLYLERTVVREAALGTTARWIATRATGQA